MIYTLYLNPTIDKTIYLEKLLVGGTNRPDHVVCDGAGKAVNVSVVLKELGAETMCFGIVFDNDMDIIKGRLEESDIPYYFDEYPGKSRVNTKIFDMTAKKITEINESGEPLLSEAYDKLCGELLGFAAPGDTVVLTGSIPSGAPGNIYAFLAGELKKQGVRCVVDASGQVFADAVNHSPYFIKPNEDEISVICDTTVTMENAADVIVACAHKYNIECVAMSMGAKGAFITDGKEVYFADALEVDVQSTVGAGDSMVAGILFGMEKGIEYALKCGIAAASASVMREGTQLMLKKDYDNLFEQVKIKKIV